MFEFALNVIFWGGVALTALVCFWMMAEDMVLVGIILLVMLIAGVIAILSYDPGPTMELVRLEWTCTSSHTDTTTTYVQSGKVMVPITNESEVCDQYSRAR